MSALVAVLRYHHPHARITQSGPTVQVVFTHEGLWHSARIRTRPVAEIYVGAPGFGDFTLAVQQGDWLQRLLHDGPVVGKRLIRTNDRELARLWLDDRSMEALDRAVERVWWSVDLAGGELAVLKGAPEEDPEPVHDALLAGATLVAASHRVAARWLTVARALGGTTSGDRWTLDGDFAVTCERGGVAVRIDNVRQRPGERSDHHRLRTRVAARRLPTSGSDTAIAQRLAAAPALLAAAGSVAPEIHRGEIALWYEGLVTRVERLTAAADLCARLAVDVASAASGGPYR